MIYFKNSKNYQNGGSQKLVNQYLVSLVIYAIHDYDIVKYLTFGKKSKKIIK